MTYEFDRVHAITAMAGPVQPVRARRLHRTPLSVFSTPDGVAIMLTYGPNRDWLKNLQSAGSGRLRRYGKTFELTDPRVVPKAEAAQSVKGLWRPIFARLPFEHAVLLRRA